VEDRESLRLLRRRTVATGAVAAGAAGVLAACGDAAPAAAPTAAPAKAEPTKAPAAAPTTAPAAAAPTKAPEPTKAPAVLKGATVRWLGGEWSFLPALTEVLEAFGNDWAKQNNVTITFEKVTDILPRVQTAIETKGGADIIQYSSPPATIAAALADVSDIADFLGKEGGGYLPAAPFQQVVDGKWLGIPMGQHNWFVNYRQDWFKEEGLAGFPDTWEEALKVGEKLKAKGRPYGVCLSDQASGDGNANARLLLWAFGGKEFNPDGSLALDGKETLAALEFAIELHNKANDPGGVGYNDASNNQGFLASKISMALNVNTIYLPATKNNPDIAAGMNHALPPKGPGGRFGYGQLPFWGIFNHTKGADLDAAKDLLKQFFSIKNYGKFIQTGQGYILPLLPAYEKEAVWPTDPKLAIAKEMFKTALPAGHALKFQTKLSSLIQDRVILGKLFSRAASTGNAKQALADTMKEIDDLKKLS
jgi:multiple sugar transport system substrate-binding protein